MIAIVRKGAGWCILYFGGLIPNTMSAGAVATGIGIVVMVVLANVLAQTPMQRDNRLASSTRKTDLKIRIDRLVIV